MKHTLLLLSVIATQAHAQIIYTDVIPDAVYSGTNDTCSLDLNNDGNIDFLIVQSTLQAECETQFAINCPGTRPRSWVKITSTGANAAAETASYASQLPQGDAIGPALTWNNTTAQVLLTQGVPTCSGSPVCNLGSFTGSWLNGASVDSPKFLGLRFESAGNTFYGWARLSIPTNGTSFTLKDYAYNSVPAAAILAGDNGTGFVGITSTALRGMQLSPNPFTSVLNITLPTGTTGAVNYRVLSLLGQAVITRTVAATSGPSAITLDLGSLAPGTYLLEMQVDGERMVRKVVKE